MTLLLSMDALARHHGRSLRSIKKQVDHDADEALKILMGGEFYLTPSERAKLLVATKDEQQECDRQQHVDDHL